MQRFARRPRRWLALLCLLVVGAAPVALRATTVIEKTFADLCVEADTIFVGTVDGVSSREVEDSGGSIETLVTFKDVEVLFGAKRGEITLRFSGGELNG